MTNLNDKKLRQELIRGYLNAETTLEEECLLADFLSDTDIALSAEEEDVLLMLQISNLIGRPEISKEKADEFDRLMQIGSKKSKIVALRWIVSAVAVILCVVLFWPVYPTDNAGEHPELTMVIPTGSNITSNQEPRNISTNIITEEQTLNIEKTTKKKLAENRATEHKHCKGSIRKQAQTGTVKTQDISTSELLETINILSDVGTDDITITASSCNDGFIIKTSTSNEPPSSYMLKRCSDGTSIELKSQLINF